jgi:hypothetical protein
MSSVIDDEDIERILQEINSGESDFDEYDFDCGWNFNSVIY